MRPLARTLIDESHRQAWSIRPEIAARMNPANPADAGWRAGGRGSGSGRLRSDLHLEGPLDAATLEGVDVLLPTARLTTGKPTVGEGSPSTNPPRSTPSTPMSEPAAAGRRRDGTTEVRQHARRHRRPLRHHHRQHDRPRSPGAVPRCPQLGAGPTGAHPPVGICRPTVNQRVCIGRDAADRRRRRRPAVLIDHQPTASPPSAGLIAGALRRRPRRRGLDSTSSATTPSPTWTTGSCG